MQKQTIIRNLARCLICHEEIESKTRHSYVTCTCGNLSVDGGKDYLRRSYKRIELAIPNWNSKVYGVRELLNTYDPNKELEMVPKIAKKIAAILEDHELLSSEKRLISYLKDAKTQAQFDRILNIFYYICDERRIWVYYA